MLPKTAQHARNRVFILRCDESTHVPGLRRAIEGVLLRIDGDVEFVVEKLLKCAVVKVQDVAVTHGKRIIENSHFPVL